MDGRTDGWMGGHTSCFFLSLKLTAALRFEDTRNTHNTHNTHTHFSVFCSTVVVVVVDVVAVWWW